MNIYLKNKTGTIDAIADFNSEIGMVIIKKGSRIAKELSNAPTFRSRKSMLKKREGTVIDAVLQTDMELSSLSTAATFVMGSNRDGWITWKDDKGNTMADLFHR